ncbi:MAG: hypothetical protein OEQ13_00970 [Acidobacteriota bacterium]|nr:hypothetical protein [Acidobacteriota bacterium]
MSRGGVKGIGDPESLGTAFFVLVGVIFVVVVVLLVEAWYYGYEQRLVSERLVQTPIEEAVRVEAEQQRLLEGYAMADEERNAVRIPIDRAMDLIVLEAQGK